MNNNQQNSNDFKGISLLILLVVAINSSNAQTNLFSSTGLSGTLTKSASPYYVKGNIFVPKDSTLIIEPGVQIRFDGKFQLSVYGNIKALGAEGDTIRFYPLDTNNRWKGIRYYGRSRVKDSAIFKYCKFEGAGFKKVFDGKGMMHFERGGMKIRLDPPQKNTPFNHMHLELGKKQFQSSYDIFLNRVFYDSPGAHIPIR